MRKKTEKSFFSRFLHFFHHSKTALMKSASRRNREYFSTTRYTTISHFSFCSKKRFYQLTIVWCHQIIVFYVFCHENLAFFSVTSLKHNHPHVPGGAKGFPYLLIDSHIVFLTKCILMLLKYFRKYGL